MDRWEQAPGIDQTAWPEPRGCPKKTAVSAKVGALPPRDGRPRRAFSRSIRLATHTDPMSGHAMMSYMYDERPMTAVAKGFARLKWTDRVRPLHDVEMTGPPPAMAHATSIAVLEDANNANETTVDSLRSLVEPAARGDRDALAQLMRALAPRVLGVARRILGRQAPEAQEVCQEALIAVADALPRFRGESTIGYFATRVTVRLALQTTRSDRARKRREERVLADHRTPVPSPIDEAHSARRRAAMRKLLAKLPEEQAEALALQVVEGLSPSEIAQVTGVPVNTVRSRVRMAKDALRVRIDRNPEYRELLK